ncbi:MAG: branched-chain amino acid transporter permease, partial [Clostridia bacterium]|nr:branched-chain amino acid transporter permease [Clostridia bacterium]
MQQIKTVAPSVRKSLMNNWLLQIIIVAILAVIPFITGRPTQNMLILIFCMSVFAMSYDILLGYTGVISFGHAMFFGI